jgi:hypothetical protein
MLKCVLIRTDRPAYHGDPAVYHDSDPPAPGTSPVTGQAATGTASSQQPTVRGHPPVDTREAVTVLRQTLDGLPGARPAARRLWRVITQPAAALMRLRRWRRCGTIRALDLLLIAQEPLATTQSDASNVHYRGLSALLHGCSRRRPRVRPPSPHVSVVLHGQTARRSPAEILNCPPSRPVVAPARPASRAGLDQSSRIRQVKLPAQRGCKRHARQVTPVSFLSPKQQLRQLTLVSFLPVTRRRKRRYCHLTPVSLFAFL